MPLNALTHFIHQFLLVILLVKVNKSYFVLNGKMSHHTGAGGGGGSEKYHQMSPGGGSKKCGKSVTYYLNGP